MGKALAAIAFVDDAAIHLVDQFAHNGKTKPLPVSFARDERRK